MNTFINGDDLDFLVFRFNHEEKNFPNWMIRYFNSLSEVDQWNYFNDFKKIESQLLSSSYLIDQLKWILKSDPVDLEYHFYVQLIFDPEADIDSLFKPGGFERLDQIYKERFDEEFQEAFNMTNEVSESSQCFSMDILPF